MDETRLFRIACAVITDEAGRLLLVRKAGTGAFMQPGGKLEPGEGPREALARELDEELGVRPPASAFQYLGLFTAPAANEPDWQVEAALYRVCDAGPATPGAEIAELAWIDPREVGSMTVAPLTRLHVFPLLGVVC